MLILTRRVNETICIGDNIRITVTKVTGAKVSLGIEAPREIPVHRKEIQATRAQGLPADWVR